LLIHFVKQRFVMKEVMLHKENPLTGDWLCWIPNTPQAYYCSTKKKAKEFCDKVNKAFAAGELKFDEDGRMVKVNVD
jgi:hypothetical protein